MDGSSSRIGTVVVTLAVGVAVGYIIAKVTTPVPGRCYVVADHTVMVDSAGSLDCTDVEIGQLNQVSWQGPAGMAVRITYSDNSVFPAASCASNTCFSGRPTVTWKPGETKRTVDYTLLLTGGTQPAPTRGRIIIDK